MTTGATPSLRSASSSYGNLALPERRGAKVQTADLNSYEQMPGRGGRQGTTREGCCQSLSSHPLGQIVVSPVPAGSTSSARPLRGILSTSRHLWGISSTVGLPRRRKSSTRLPRRILSSARPSRAQHRPPPAPVGLQKARPAPWANTFTTPPAGDRLFDPVASRALLVPARPCGGVPALDQTPWALFVPLSPRERLGHCPAPRACA